MVSLRDAFEEYDADDSGALDFEEFAAAIMQYKLTTQEIRSLFMQFDTDGNGAVEYDEFVEGIRGELSPERRAIISNVFDNIDEDGDGIINSSDIGKHFLPAKHPDCETRGGTKTVAAILNDFMETFQVVGNNGSLTKGDLMEYFSNTASFVNEDFFVDMMSSIWKKGFKKRSNAPVEGSLAAYMDPDAVKKTEDKKPLYSVSSSGEDYSNESFKKAKAYLIKHIASEGVKGMVALRDLFNEMDVNDDGTLSYEEFGNVMNEYKLSNQEIRALYVGFDKDGDGCIDYMEFCYGIRGPMSHERKVLVSDVFDGIDSDCDGIISCGDIGRCFVLKNHPDVKKKRKPASVILNEFLLTFEDAGTNGCLNKSQFLEYYSNISAFIEEDDFIELMNSIWKVPRRGKSMAKASIQGTLGASIAEKKHEEKKASIRVTPRKPIVKVSPAAPIVASLKASLAKRGARGISGVSRKFKILDDDGSKSLNMEEFKKGMRECELDLSAKELNLLFAHFDKDGSGSLDFEEFLQGLRDPMSERRLRLVNMAFDVIDLDGNGIVDVEEVVQCYDASQHPKVKSGEMKANDVLMEFLETFEVGETVDGKVTRQEFINYYHNLSASIDNEDYWELMIRNAWHISGGKGQAANSANTRVLATMADGSQQVVEVQKDLGMDRTNQSDVIARLKKQGVKGVKGVSTSGSCDDESTEGKPVTLAELAERQKRKAAQPKGGPGSKTSEEKKEEGKGKKVMSLMGMMEGKTIYDEDKPKSGPGLPPPPPKQRSKREVGNSAVPSAGLNMIIAKMKSQMKKHGANGFIGLSRKFRIMDDDESGTLSLGEFNKAMKELKMGLNDMEVRLLFEHFDEDHSGGISFEEFIQGCRDPLTQRRLDLVNKAFDIIDKDGSGVVEPKEIMDCYDAKMHPEVKAGKKTEDEVLREFLSTFDVGGVVDGMVTREEFQNYYTNIGANIDRDDYFELMMRNAWHISGGSGASASSANKRVLITDSSGRQKVVEIENDLGLDRVPEKQRPVEIMKRLRAQGVDVCGIDIKGGVEDKGDELGPKYKPSINQKFSSAAPGVLPGTGVTIHSNTYNKNMQKGNRLPDKRSRPVAIEDMITRMKEMMSKRGAKGLVGMARKFRSMDDDGNRILDLGEFTKGLWEMDLECSAADIKRLFDFFDDDGSGGLDYEELVHAMRDPLNERRKELVLLAFSKLDEDESGIIEPAELLDKYDASQHPDVMGGLKTEEEVIKEFVACFEVGGVVDGMVTQEEFLNYYENLGVNIDNDDYFELMIRNAWHISGGKGWCENSSNLRVKCLMPDGSEQIVEIKDDLGVRADDYHTIRRKLKQQGVNAVGIDTKGAIEEEKKKGELGGKNGVEQGNKSSRNAHMSLGSQFRNRKKNIDPSSAPVARGKSGHAAFGEVKGATVMDALRGTGQATQQGDKKRTGAGEADHGVKMILNNLKRQIKKRGGGGMIGLSRKFKIMDDSGDGELQMAEFRKAMNEMDFDLNDKDLHKMFDHFDTDGGGTISYEEFVQGVRDPLSERRLNLIKLAFNQIDHDGSGVIEAHEVASAYDPSKHPEVISGKKTPQQVLEEFLRTFDVGGVVDGSVTLQEFTNYYHNVSASIFNEDYFELMIRNAWHISGGTGQAANSANKRVLVTGSDGKQRVVEINNDLGLDRVPEKQRNAEIMKRLKAQGVDVMGVESRGSVGDDDVASDPNAPNPSLISDMKRGQSFTKGGGALQNMTRSQIVLSGGCPDDDLAYRKKMGLSSSNAKGNAHKARSSNLGPGGVEREETGEYEDYVPGGVVGGASAKRKGGSSLAVLAGKKKVDAILEKLREELKRRGARGIAGLARKFRIMDDDGSKSLDVAEFSKAMRECNLMLGRDDLGMLFAYFDADGGGTITYDEFLEGVRGEVSSLRRELIMLAFDVIDKDGNGVLEPEDVVDTYDASKHPDVLTGRKTRDEVLAEFLDTFDVGGEKDGMVTRDEFVNYYKNVSASIDSDEYFELMIRNAWHITGGKGASENSANMRVFVVHKDGREEIVVIQNDLGLKVGDKKEAMLRLRRQGLNPASVSFFDSSEEEDKKPAENLNWKTTFKLG
ncbi:hypothetical protein TrRE_jg5132 [Triparma retinervis]|uniref:EF-hand domain-containing protein n=1 Tax=Triparma retinervis TaxID=2557542 RepID=A0A9W7DQG0_9STRA|nr:hypothetical protein TrRE_jg5132 [Triparma retinervis]